MTSSPKIHEKNLKKHTPPNQPFLEGAEMNTSRELIRGVTNKTLFFFFFFIIFFSQNVTLQQKKNTITSRVDKKMFFFYQLFANAIDLNRKQNQYKLAHLRKDLAVQYVLVGHRQ